ncbi:hypothetical protein [Parabacteroides sp.]
MNRTYKTFCLCLLAGCCLLLGNCSSEEPVEPVPTAGKPLEVNASISGPTRADYSTSNGYDKTAFIEGDVIAITPDSKSTSYSYTYQSDIWKPVATTDSIKVTGNTEFTASYPASFTEILANQSLSETVNEVKDPFASYKKSNQFIATATSENNLIYFEFAPAAAKIRLVITYPDGETHTGVSAKITGEKVLNNTNTGNPDTGSKNQTITLLPITTEGQTHVYVGIVYPGVNKSYTITVEENKVESTEAGSTTTTTLTHTHNESSRTLVAGTEYTYNFSSNSNLILNSVTVTEFVNGGNQNLGNAT